MGQRHQQPRFILNKSGIPLSHEGWIRLWSFYASDYSALKTGSVFDVETTKGNFPLFKHFRHRAKSTWKTAVAKATARHSPVSLQVSPRNTSSGRCSELYASNHTILYATSVQSYWNAAVWHSQKQWLQPSDGDGQAHGGVCVANQVHGVRDCRHLSN